MNNSETNKKEFLDGLKTFVIVLAIALIFRIFIFNFTTVKGHSMDDTLHENDVLLVDKIGTNFRNYKRGDIVILDAPDLPKKLYVKRIVGLPGEKIDIIDGNFYINGEKLEEDYTNAPYTYENEELGINSWTLSKDEYFVVGDNRIKNISKDSRTFGPIKRDSLEGHVTYRFYPFDNIGSLH